MSIVVFVIPLCKVRITVCHNNGLYPPRLTSESKGGPLKGLQIFLLSSLFSRYCLVLMLYQVVYILLFFKIPSTMSCKNRDVLWQKN